MRSFECDAEFPTEPVAIVEVGGVSAEQLGQALKLMDIYATFPLEAVFQSGPSEIHWTKRLPPGVEPIVSNEWDVCWVEEATYHVAPRTRAHINKFNRHKKRPNGRPRHR